MNKPNYKYTIDGNVIFIEDLGGPFQSVTNGIETVLQEVSDDLEKNGISGTGINNFKVVYKDSDGAIDGVAIDSDGMFMNFYHIGAKNFYEAKLKIK